MPSTDRLHQILRRYWGFEQLRPLQQEAIDAQMEGRDSLVVLPTGGGKSLCYQVPPLLREEPGIVVSPLISLMKDQTDALLSLGYPAATIHSGLNRRKKREALDFLRSGRCRLALVSPERLLLPSFQELLGRLGVKSFAVDEAHCISHWGHDFRPEYRRLSALKQAFPEAGVHAYTATATPRVRRDIMQQLQLQDPVELVGRFDRPNLVYRIVPRQRLKRQVLEVLARHAGEASIVYCISRKETESVAESLAAKGVKAEAYHAGLGKEERRQAQEAFTHARIDVVVATVAFGMGIDRSDVRCVIHAGMPKSIEHYQQETGRAGRDGLEAECVLFFSPADSLRWKNLIEKSAAEGNVPSEVVDSSLYQLQEMRRYCAPGQCRHARLSEYFGQSLEESECGACDVCLGECADLVDGTDDARKILSCVARVGQRFGVGHVVNVLRGLRNQQVITQGHDRLSTFGLLQEASQQQVTNQIFQLLDQELLTRTNGDYPVLKLNPRSLEVLRGERPVQLLPIKTKKVRKAQAATESWEGVDKALFERLRNLRTNIARRQDVPPYVVFSDRTLREMSRLKPTNSMELLLIHGVGEKKLAEYGEMFLKEINRPDGDSTAEMLTSPAS